MTQATSSKRVTTAVTTSAEPTETMTQATSSKSVTTDVTRSAKPTATSSASVTTKVTRSSEPTATLSTYVKDNFSRSAEPAATITLATPSLSVTADVTAYDEPTVTTQVARSSLDLTHGFTTTDMPATRVTLKTPSFGTDIFKATFSSELVTATTETFSTGVPTGAMTPARSFFTSGMSEVAASGSVTRTIVTSLTLTQRTKASRGEAETTQKDVPKSTARSISSPTSATSFANHATTTPGTTTVILGSPAFPSSLDVFRSATPETLSPARSHPLVFSTSMKFSPMETWSVRTTARIPSSSSCSKGYNGVDCTGKAILL